MSDRWVGLQAGVDARKWAGLLRRALISVLALVVMARRGQRLAHSLRLGPVNAGLITGVVVMTGLIFLFDYLANNAVTKIFS